MHNYTMKSFHLFCPCGTAQEAECLDPVHPVRGDDSLSVLSHLLRIVLLPVVHGALVRVLTSLPGPQLEHLGGPDDLDLPGDGGGRWREGDDGLVAAVFFPEPYLEEVLQRAPLFPGRLGRRLRSLLGVG